MLRAVKCTHLCSYAVQSSASREPKPPRPQPAALDTSTSHGLDSSDSGAEEYCLLAGAGDILSNCWR